MEMGTNFEKLVPTIFNASFFFQPRKPKISLKQLRFVRMYLDTKPTQQPPEIKDGRLLSCIGSKNALTTQKRHMVVPIYDWRPIIDNRSNSRAQVLKRLSPLFSNSTYQLIWQVLSTKILN